MALNLLRLNRIYVKTAMATKIVVISSSLDVTYEEVKTFALLPQLQPRDFFEFFIRNCFRFLDDVLHK